MTDRPDLRVLIRQRLYQLGLRVGEASRRVFGKSSTLSVILSGTRGVSAASFVLLYQNLRPEGDQKQLWVAAFMLEKGAAGMANLLEDAGLLTCNGYVDQPVSPVLDDEDPRCLKLGSREGVGRLRLTLLQALVDAEAPLSTSELAGSAKTLLGTARNSLHYLRYEGLVEHRYQKQAVGDWGGKHKVALWQITEAGKELVSS